MEKASICDVISTPTPAPPFMKKILSAFTKQISVPGGGGEGELFTES
jgi:hypothetical protein